MNYVTEKNNKVYLKGEIVSDAAFSHEVYGEGFYEFFVSVPRLSGQRDELPVTVSERLMLGTDLTVGNKVTIHHKAGNRGKVEISYYSVAELEKIIDILEGGSGR